MKDRSFLPLVSLDAGTNYFGAGLGIGFPRLIGHSGGGEGVGGVVLRGQQVLMGLLGLFFGQLRGVAGCRGLGVSRCHGLGVIEAGSEVRYRDLAQLGLEVRIHLRPEVRQCLHVGGGGHGRGDAGAGAKPPEASWS